MTYELSVDTPDGDTVYVNHRNAEALGKFKFWV